MRPTIRKTSSTWTIVLAAGEGARLRPLTKALYGEDLPKQFATIHGGSSLLQATLRRASRLSPPERTVVVVASEREELARSQVRAFGDIDVVAQPKNIGTGPGILLPLSRVVARDPDAMVAIIPSDHFVRDEGPFVDSIKRGEAASRADDAVVLIAAVPDAPEIQYGWIVTVRDDEGRAPRVVRFAEKPDPSVAGELFQAGALWNTFIMVGAAKRYWELAEQHLSSQTALFREYLEALGTAGERTVLSALYDRMAAADFSRDVLEKAAALRAISFAACGWSDWGTPDRIFRSLRGTPDYDLLVARLNAAECRRANAKKVVSTPVAGAEMPEARA